MDISVTNYAKSLSKGMHACQHKAMTSYNTSLLKNGPNSNCNFEKAGHAIPVKPTQPKRRETRKCHYGKKPCGISVVKYSWPSELAEFRWSPCFYSILKDSLS